MSEIIGAIGIEIGGHLVISYARYIYQSVAPPPDEAALKRVLGIAVDRTHAKHFGGRFQHSRDQAGKLVEQFLRNRSNADLLAQATTGPDKVSLTKAVCQRYMEYDSENNLSVSPHAYFSDLVNYTCEEIRLEAERADSPLFNRTVVSSLSRFEVTASQLLDTVDEVRKNVEYLQATHQDLEAQIAESLTQLIETRLQESMSRCANRWRALGVDEATAQRLANDLSIGKPTEAMLPTPTSRMRVLVGDYGAGKSLTAERIFQSACSRFIFEKDSPIPVYVRAEDVIGALEDLLRSRIGPSWQPGSSPVFMIVDGLDEAGLSKGADIYRQAGIAVESWDGSCAVLTSRPQIQTTEFGVKVTIPDLSSDEAGRIIHGIDPSVNAYHFTIPRILHEDVKRPFFAVLLGVFVRNGGRISQLDKSIDALTDLFKTCTDRRYVKPTRAISALKEIAINCIESGGFECKRPESVTDEVLDDLLESRVIACHDDKIRFTLPILAQWFATRAIRESDIDYSNVVADEHTIELWYYPISLLLGTSDHEKFSEYVEPIMRSAPGIASRLIEGVLTGQPKSGPLAALSAVECGKRIRSSMEPILEALGPLGEILLPLEDDGTLPPIATRRTSLLREDDSLEAGWLQWSNEKEKSVELGVRHRAVTITRNIVGHDAWAWEWSLDYSTRALAVILKAMALPPTPGGTYWRESMWRSALAVTGKGGHTYSPIPLSELNDERIKVSGQYIETRTNRGVRRIGYDENPIPPGDLHYYATGMVSGPIAKDVSGHCYWPAYLRREVACMRANGNDILTCPYPDRDVPRKTNYIGSGFSDSALLLRTEMVFRNAIQIYEELVRTYFPKFSQQLNMFRKIPVEVEGEIDTTHDYGPMLTYQFVCKPPGSTSSVKLSIAENDKHSDTRARMMLSGSQVDAANKWRPDCADWLTMELTRSVMDWVFGDSLGTKLAYNWLWKDLSRICWLKDELHTFR